MSAVLDRCPPEAVTDDAWLAALRYRAIGRTAGDLRERAAIVTQEQERTQLLAVADRVDALAAEGLTPVKCWYLGGLDQWFGPYAGTPEATP